MIPVILAVSQEVDASLGQMEAWSGWGGSMRKPSDPTAPDVNALRALTWEARFAWMLQLPLDDLSDALSLQNARKIAWASAMGAMARARGEDVKGIERAPANQAAIIELGGSLFVLVRIGPLPVSAGCLTMRHAVAWARETAQPALSQAFGCEALPVTGLSLAAGKQQHEISQEWGAYFFDRAFCPGDREPLPTPIARACAFFEAQELAAAVKNRAQIEGSQLGVREIESTPTRPPIRI